MHSLKFLSVGIVGAILAVGIALGFPLATNAAPILPNGFTAKVIATSGQIISGNIDATGYDVGIYIGPGVKNVMVIRAKVSNANYEGILVQDTSGIVIKNSTIENNGAGPTGPERKAIELGGTSYCLVENNIVKNNKGDGGIGLTDGGPVDPNAPNPIAIGPIASIGNVITGNLVEDNLVGCGIVMSAWNPGAGLSHNIVSNNTLIGGVGGIVVATDLPNTKATDNVVLNNKVTGSQIMGIIVHSNAPGDVVSGTKVIGNTLSNDGNEGPPYDPTSPTGIAIVAEVPGVGAVLTDTLVLLNSISHETYGIWVYYNGNTPDTHIAMNHFDSSVTTPASIHP
jgi:hypothetical protein